MTTAERLRAAFSPDRVRYRNFPDEYAREDYDRAIERYVAQASRTPGVLGIGRFGNVTAPGISDIDLVVVTEETLSAGARSALSIEGLSEADRNLFMHEPAIVPADGIGHVCEHLDVPAVDSIWGTVPAPPAPGQAERRWHELAILMEWLGCFCKFFGEIASLELSNVRWALPVLHSMRYSTKLAAAFLGEAPNAWTDYPVRVAALRSEWFSLPSDAVRAERLAEALAEGWFVTADLCVRLDRWIGSEGLLPSSAAPGQWRIYSYAPAMFAIAAGHDSADQMVARALDLAAWDGLAAARRLQRIRRRVAPSWSVVPRFHDAFGAAAASSAPIVHRRTLRRWFGGQQIVPMVPHSPFEHYLCARMERLERQAHFLEGNRLGFGAACSELIYSPPLEDEATDSWRRKLLLTAQKAWGTGRARALAQSAA
ncbi:MAG TPA: hypothetical protein VKT77_14865 [Chthonomonadaceae bacterium]|nr:hypothetical protein [Chthonomonadaceae bacterium]